MGFYNRAAVVTGPGAVVGDGENVPSLEDVVDNFGAIASLEKGKEYFQLNDQFGDVMLAFSQPAAAVGPDAGGAGSGGPTVAEVFDNMPEAFVPEAADGVDVSFQYVISGEGGGDWYSVIQNNACTVEAGKLDKPVCTIKMAAADFLAMMGGQLPAMQAYTSGKLVIEGDIMKSQLIEKLFKF